jgi:hypothetical protein
VWNAIGLRIDRGGISHKGKQPGLYFLNGIKAIQIPLANNGLLLHAGWRRPIL